MINSPLGKQNIVVKSLKSALKELDQSSCVRSSDDFQAYKHTALTEKHFQSVRSIVSATKSETEEIYKAVRIIYDYTRKFLN